MKITLLTENWHATGGIENYLWNIADHLPEASVTVLTSQPEQGESGRVVRAGSSIAEVQTQRLLWPLLKPAWLPNYRRLVKHVKAGEIDVLLCGKGLFEGLLGYHLKKKTGTPYIVFTYAMEIATWAQRPGVRQKLVKALTNADRVAYINDVTKQQLLDLGVRTEQLLKLQPGVDDRHFNAVSEPLVDATLRQLGVSQPYVLSVGRLIERKGFDTLIEAFAKLDQTRFGDYQLIVVGDGPEREALEKAADEHFISTSVKFLSDVPDKQLPALYAGATVFAMTPRELPDDLEGFGIVYLEAAAHGVPAIATKTGGAQEAVIHGETGLVVEPDDVGATAKALEQLLSDETQRTNLGEQAKVKADVQALQIIAEGTVEGDLHSEEAVIITKTADVSGNIFAPRISIENGATFNGRIEMQRKRGEKSSAKPEKQAAPEPVVEQTLEVVVPVKESGRR